MKKLHVLFIITAISLVQAEVVVLDELQNSSQNTDYHSKDEHADEETHVNDSIQNTQLNSEFLSGKEKQQVPSEQQHQELATQSRNKPEIKVHAILDLTLGNEYYNDDTNRIDIYVAPSCLHCGRFLVDDLQKFMDLHSRNCFIRIRLLPTSAKDLFIMKIIQGEARDVNGYYMIYINYIRRTLATINRIQPTAEQQTVYKGSATDPEMIKFQVIASNFGFSDDKIVAAIPNMKGYYEIAVMDWYKKVVKTIEPFCPNKDLNLPLFIQNGKSYRSLSDIPLSSSKSG